MPQSTPETSAAAAALKHAEDFTKSVSAQAPPPAKPKAKAAAPAAAPAKAGEEPRVVAPDKSAVEGASARVGKLGEAMKAAGVGGYAKGGVAGKDAKKASKKDTVPAMLEPGEAVIPKKTVDKHSGMVKALLTAGHDKDAKDEGKKKGEKPGTKEVKKSKHRVHTMHVKRAHGGFIINHEHEPAADGSLPTPEQNPPHVVPDMAGLHAHMDEHMGENEGTLAGATPSTEMPA